MKSLIEDRLTASLKYDTINSDNYFERTVVEIQIKEAIEELKMLRKIIKTEEMFNKKECEG